MSLGTNLSALRQRAGMSQDALAERLEVSRQSVSKWETDASVPELEKLVKLADIFGVTLDELVKDLPPGTQVPPAGRYTEGAQAQDTQDRPEASRPRVSHGQHVAGMTLLILAGALAAALLVLWGPDGLVLAAILALALVPCGIICLNCPKRAGLWCAWVVYILAEGYNVAGTGVSSSTVLVLFSGINPEVLSQMTIQIAFSAVILAVLVGLIAWTLWDFRKTPLPRKVSSIALVAGLWIGRFALGWGVGNYVMPWLSSVGMYGALTAAMIIVALGQDILTAAAIVSTVAILRRPLET